jgi:hypothetical protein
VPTGEAGQRGDRRVEIAGQDPDAPLGNQHQRGVQDVLAGRTKVRQGRFDLSRFVSETVALGDVESAFEKMRRGEVLRSVVVL